MTVISFQDKSTNKKIDQCLTILHAVSDKIDDSVDSHRVKRVWAIKRQMEKDQTREPVDKLRYHLMELFTTVNRRSDPVTNADLRKVAKALAKALKNESKSDLLL